MSKHAFFQKYFPKSSSRMDQPIFLTACPEPVSDIYVLRAEQEEALYQALRQGGRHILLYGPGGSGKTHLARKLFYRLSNDYERLAWVEYGTDLRTALTAPPEENCEENRDVLFDKGIQTLEAAPEKTILFIDDAKENAMDDDILAQVTGMGITIFMTSRCKKISPYETWEIAPITLSDCVNLFYAHYHFDPQRTHKRIVRKLVSQLECNVFSILLLAKVVGEQSNLSRIARQLQKGSLMTHIGQLLSLADLSPTELLVLQCFALMPSGETPNEISSWLGFPLEWADRLCDKGWLDKAGKSNGYILHDLLREHLNSEGLPDRITTSLLSAFLQDSFFSTNETAESIEYKLAAIQRALARAEKETPLYILSLLRIAELRSDRGQYQSALNYSLNALQSAQQIDDCPADLLHDVHWQLAMHYHNCGMYPDALSHYHQCEAYHAQITASPFPILAGLWNNMGTCYNDMGHYDEALHYYQKAISIEEEHLGFYHHDTAGTYGNIGNSYNSIGKYKEALAYHKKALAIREQLGDKPLLTAAAYDNLGVSYRSLGEFTDSLNYHLKALRIREKLLGSGHPDTAITYYNLGVTYDRLNDSHNSLLYGCAAYKIFSKMLGPDHNRTQQAFNVLQARFQKHCPDQEFSVWLSQQPS